MISDIEMVKGVQCLNDQDLCTSFFIEFLQKNHVLTDLFLSLTTSQGPKGTNTYKICNYCSTNPPQQKGMRAVIIRFVI